MNSDNDDARRDRIDQIGLEALRSSRMSDDELDRSVSGAFLFARIRARIAAEQQRRGTGEASWWLGLLNAWRPLAGMAGMAIVAATLFLFSAVGGSSNNNTPINSDDALAIGEPGFERIVFTDGEALSNDEVLATIMKDETEVRR
jgi:hypothetical protein